MRGAYWIFRFRSARGAVKRFAHLVPRRAEVWSVDRINSVDDGHDEEQGDNDEGNNSILEGNDNS